jgi:hypothetical protein
VLVFVVEIKVVLLCDYGCDFNDFINMCLWCIVLFDCIDQELKSFRYWNVGV